MTTLREVMSRPVAHRGLHDLPNGVAENSAKAFQRAIERNLAIECDLQLSGDGVPMVIHDSTLDRVTDQPGKVSALSAGQIGRIPLAGSAEKDCALTFSQLLELIDSRVAIAVELKPQSTDEKDAEMAKAAVAALNAYHGPLAFISFSPNLLKLVRRYGYKGPLGIIVERFVSELAQEHLNPWQRFSMRHLLHYPFTRFDFIDCDHKALDLPAVRLFHFLGFPLAAWTITSQAEADEALKHCDQIAFEGFIPRSA